MNGIVDRMLAGGALATGAAASSCCVLPLAFAAAGVGGAWIGVFPQLAPYQPIFLILGALCIGLGFWRAYGRDRAVCDGPNCGASPRRPVAKGMLWVATVLVIIAGSVKWWAGLLT